MKQNDVVDGLRVAGNELRVAETNEFIESINSHRGEEITLIVKREKEIKEITVTPRLNPKLRKGRCFRGGNIKYSVYPLSVVADAV